MVRPEARKPLHCSDHPAWSPGLQSRSELLLTVDIDEQFPGQAQDLRLMDVWFQHEEHDHVGPRRRHRSWGAESAACLRFDTLSVVGADHDEKQRFTVPPRQLGDDVPVTKWALRLDDPCDREQTSNGEQSCQTQAVPRPTRSGRSDRCHGREGLRVVWGLFVGGIAVPEEVVVGATVVDVTVVVTVCGGLSPSPQPT